MFWNRTLFRIFNTKLRNFLVLNYNKQQFKPGKSITQVSLMQEIYKFFGSFFERLILFLSVDIS